MRNGRQQVAKHEFYLVYDEEKDHLIDMYKRKLLKSTIFTRMNNTRDIFLCYSLLNTINQSYW